MTTTTPRYRLKCFFVLQESILWKFVFLPLPENLFVVSLFLQVLPASSFSIMLGLHDRSKKKEPNRLKFHCTKRWFSKYTICNHPCSIRRHIRVDKIIIHEDFKDSVYDIALLKLGKKSQFFLNLSMNLQLSVWISHSSTLPVFPLMMKSLSARKDLFMVRTDQIKDVKD